MTRPQPLESAEGTTGREEWSLDPAKRHLNHGSFGAVPRRTLDHQAALKRELEANPLRWFDSLPARLADERAALAPFVGASADEIAVLPNASAGASVLFANLTLQPGDEVLATDHVYGSVLMGAERFTRRDGASLRVVPIPLAATAGETFDLLESHITPATRVLLIDHISSATARGFPVAELVAAATAAGIIVMVDGAHALGLVETPARVADSDNAVWFGNLHKFACAPRGAAVLVARGALGQNLYPLVDSWGAQLDYPERFDQQGTNDVTGFLSASFGIALIERLWGWQRVRDYSVALGNYAVSIIAPALSELQNAPAIVELGMPQQAQRLLRLPPGVAVDGDSARILKNRLSAEADVEAGIMPWQGSGYLRISAHVYNEAADYEQFVERGIPVIESLSHHAP